LVAAGLAKGTGLEPNPAEDAKLQGRQGPYSYLPVFLGNGGPPPFHLTPHPRCSSPVGPDAPGLRMVLNTGWADPGGNTYDQSRERVETVRMDDLGSSVVIDFLKIDVQGYELEIMRHGTGKLANTVMIECEAEFVPLYRGQPLFGDIQCFLREQGFVLHKLID